MQTTCYTKGDLMKTHLSTKRHLIYPLFAAALIAGAGITAACSSPVSMPPSRTDSVSGFQKGDTQIEELKVLTIGTADSGGTMYPVGDAISQVLSQHDRNIKVNLSASNGSFNNVEEILDGQIDMGLVSGDIAFSAYFGTDEFEGNPDKNLCTIGAVYSSLSNWMVPDASGIYYVHDLVGHRAAIGPEGSTTERAARIALDAAGITDSNAELGYYGLGSGSNEVEKGTVDAVHGFAGIPVTGLTDLAQAIPCHLLKYTKKELNEIISSNSFYYKAVIPAGTYPGQNEDIDTFGIKCLLCVSADMDEELVYTITRILNESRDQLAEIHPALASLTQKDYIYDGLSIPLHPGAEAYYRETGCLEP